MTPSEPSTPQDPTARQPLTPVEEAEAAASVVELGAGLALRGIELTAAVLLGLLLCPPLFILVVIVALPLMAGVVVVAVAGAVLAAPYLLVRHLRGRPSPHAAVFAARARHAARALVDLLPHRIAAATRR